jgi:hypothetical protein
LNRDKWLEGREARRLESWEASSCFRNFDFRVSQLSSLIAAIIPLIEFIEFVEFIELIGLIKLIELKGLIELNRI